jgi:superfamily II DNA/RNA helicase
VDEFLDVATTELKIILKPFQIESFNHIFRGKNFIAIAPTGSGKSVVYQIPALLYKTKCSSNAVLVVSPLIALMNDQCEIASKLGIDVCLFSASMSSDQKSSVEKDFRKFQLFMCSPEKLNDPWVIGILSKVSLKLLCIDEFHCYSSWGETFRPSYLRLPNIIKTTFTCSNLTIIALSATATPLMIQTLKADFDINTVIRESILKENIFWHFKKINPLENLSVVHGSKAVTSKLSAVAASAGDTSSYIESKYKIVLGLIIKELPNPSGLTVVYCMLRQYTVDLAKFLSEKLSASRPVFSYHSGMSFEERALVEKNFSKSVNGLICTTIAFSLGVHNCAILNVIYYSIPSDLLTLIQGSGRAGRGLGTFANIYLLHHANEFIALEKLISLNTPETLAVVYEELERAFIDPLTKLPVPVGRFIVIPHEDVGKVKGLMTFQARSLLYTHMEITYKNCERLSTIYEAILIRKDDTNVKILLLAACAGNAELQAILMDSKCAHIEWDVKEKKSYFKLQFNRTILPALKKSMLDIVNQVVCDNSLTCKRIHAAELYHVVSNIFQPSLHDIAKQEFARFQNMLKLQKDDICHVKNFIDSDSRSAAHVHKACRWRMIVEYFEDPLCILHDGPFLCYGCCQDCCAAITNPRTS